MSWFNKKTVSASAPQTHEKIPVAMYYVLRKLGDRVSTQDIIQKDIPAKYGDIDREDLFTKAARLIHGIDESRFDGRTSSEIAQERNLMDDAIKKNNLNVDLDAPLSDEEQDHIRHINSYFDQQYFFGNGTQSRGTMPGNFPEPSSDDVKRIESIVEENKSNPSKYGHLWLDENGANLYLHKGWLAGDFRSRGMTAEDRALARTLEENPLAGVIQPDNKTIKWHDQLTSEDWPKDANDDMGGATPMYARPTKSTVRLHSEVFHGEPLTEDEHDLAHQLGVGNHTHWNE